jgi:hypothetical protein
MRKKYIDLLRTIALFYMFFQHAALALLMQTSNRGIILFFFEIVPICSALFLFIAGFSLSVSFEKNIPAGLYKFNMHLIKRGLILVILSSFLFFIEYGIQLPDLFLSSGILNTIGLMIITSIIFLNIKYKKIFLSFFILLLILATIFLEEKKIFIFPFNTGFEPVSPTIIFGFIGLLAGVVMNEFNENKIKIKYFVIGIGALGAALTVYYFYMFGPFKIFFSNTGRYEVTRIFNESNYFENIFKSGNVFPVLSPVTVWNFNTSCFFASLGVVFLLFASAFFSEGFLNKHITEKIFLPGRFAFANYFFHLSVIALLVLIFGYEFLTAKFFLLFLLSLFFSSYLLSFILYKRKRV